MLTETQAKSILGEVLFNECFSFFEEVFERRSEYKIMLTRRCFSLFKIFSPILKKYDIENTYGTIITDNAIDAYFDDIYKALSAPPVSGAAAVILVDDIIVYGRTVNKILGDLTKPSTKVKDNIRVLCMTQNKNSIIAEDYADLILPRSCASSLAWKDYSCAFSKLIKSADIANTSYIVSAKFCGEPVWDKICGNMVRTTTAELEECNVESYVTAACPTDNFFGLSKTLCGFVRVYVYRNLKSVLVAPLLILDNLSKDDLTAVSKKAADLNRGNELEKLLLDDNEALDSYKTRMLTLLLSHVLLRNFLNKTGVSSVSPDNFDYEEIIRYNFSGKLTGSFVRFDENVSKTEDGFVYKNEDICSDFHDLEDYIFLKAMEDNNSINNNKSQRNGFSTLNNKTLFSTQNAAGLMVALDNGLAALRTRFSDSRCESLMYSGEQAFRVVSDKYQKVLPAMYALENIAYVYEKDSYKLYGDFCGLLLQKNILNKNEHDKLLKYIGILKDNNQQISDVMYIDKSKQDSNLSLEINELLKNFKGEVLKL